MTSTAPALPLPAQLAAATALFRRRFGRPPHFAAAAPGRVNLIGEHTDYNAGFVLPMAIERQTLVLAAPAELPDSRTARVASTLQDDVATFTVDPSLQPGAPQWSNYFKGVVAGCLAAGLDPGGFDALVDSTVPLGSGLSSSAAIEVATATLIEAMTGKALDPVRKALLCQKAENQFAGAPCGIMDQSISVRAQESHAMLLDCRSLETRMVPLNDPGASILIANTNVKHELSGGEYPKRRAQCLEVAKMLGVPALRDATMPQLLAAKNRLDDARFRRARHVITEIARTLAAAEAMTAGNWPALGELMFASHASLRDDFEVSCAELDLLVEFARELSPDRGVYGARMTGGGFGGCTVSLVRTDCIAQISRHLCERYQAQTGITPSIFATRPARGAHIVTL